MSFSPIARDWAFDLLTALDAHLAQVRHPDQPNWARAHTALRPAKAGQAYSATLKECRDFWSPKEGDTCKLTMEGNPSWLELTQDAPGIWKLSGTPTKEDAGSSSIRLRLTSETGLKKVTDRTVELMVKTSG